MSKVIDLLLSGDYMGIISIGILFMLFMSGIMAIVFIKYISKIMKDLDNVKEIKPLVDKVDKLVDKIHKLFTSHEVTKVEHSTEIDNIKKQIEDIYAKLNDLEKRVQ